MAQSAYSPNARRAQRADGAILQAFCESRGFAFLPAEPMTVRAFIQARTTEGRKPATIRRSIATIARAHQGVGLPNPCESEPVRLALKELGRTVWARQRRALGLRWKKIKEFLESAGDSISTDISDPRMALGAGMNLVPRLADAIPPYPNPRSQNCLGAGL